MYIKYMYIKLWCVHRRRAGADDGRPDSDGLQDTAGSLGHGVCHQLQPWQELHALLVHRRHE